MNLMKLFKTEEDDMSFVLLRCDGCGFSIPVHDADQMHKIKVQKNSARLKGDGPSVSKFYFSLRSFYHFVEHISQCRSYAILRETGDTEVLLQHVTWFDSIVEKFPEAFLFYIQTKRADTIY